MTAKNVTLLSVQHFITISTSTELLRIPSDILMYITAEGNYSEVFLQDGTHRLVSFQLGQMVDLLEEQLGEDESPFIRIGKSLIVNRNFIYLVDISEQELVISDWNGKYVPIKASRKALATLKLILENPTI